MQKALRLVFLSAALFQGVANAEEIIAVSFYMNTYRIDSVTGTNDLIGSTGVMGINSLAKDRAGNLYSTDAGNQLIVINPNDGSVTPVATLDLGGATVDVPAMAFSPEDTLYLINREADDLLYSVDVNTGDGTLVGPTGSAVLLQGLACATNGALYGWDVHQGLVSVNPATGAATDLNPLEGATAQIQCLAFAPDGTLYGARQGLFTIDTATGVPSPILSDGLVEIRGMEFNTGPPLQLSITKGPDGICLCCLTQTNKLYQLQVRVELGSTSDWLNAGPAAPGTGLRACVTNHVNAGRRFFRLIATPF